MEFPHPDVYDDFKTWGRQLIRQLKTIPIVKDVGEQQRRVSTDSVYGYQNSWTDMNPTYLPAMFWRDQNHYVRFFGGITRVGTPLAGEIIFTLPPEYACTQLAHSFYLPPLTILQCDVYGCVRYGSGTYTNIHIGGMCWQTMPAYTAARWR